MRYHILQHGHLKTKVILYQLVARIFGHGAAPCSGHQRKVDASPTAGDRCANGTSRLMVDGRFQLTPDRRPAGAHAPEGNPCHDPLYRGGHQWWSGQDSSDTSHRRSAFWITAVAPVRPRQSHRALAIYTDVDFFCDFDESRALFSTSASRRCRHIDRLRALPSGNRLPSGRQAVALGDQRVILGISLGSVGLERRIGGRAVGGLACSD
jgi:hypothetical protein